MGSQVFLSGSLAMELTSQIILHREKLNSYNLVSQTASLKNYQPHQKFY